MIIKLSTDGNITRHEFPKGDWQDRHKTLTALIGPECDLVERVMPRGLYKVFGGPFGKGEVCMLVDESGWYHDLKANGKAGRMYGSFIMGDVLFVGECDMGDGPDFTGLTPEQAARLESYLTAISL